MITFSKNSWHYKFNEWVGDVELPPFNQATCRKSICSYFWSTVFNLLGFVFWWGLVYAALSGLGSACMKEFYEVSLIDMTWLWLVGGVVIITVLLVVGGIIFSLEKLKEKISNKEKLVDKEPNLTTCFWKASVVQSVPSDKWRFNWWSGTFKDQCQYYNGTRWISLEKVMDVGANGVDEDLTIE